MAAATISTASMSFDVASNSEFSQGTITKEIGPESIQLDSADASLRAADSMYMLQSPIGRD